MAIFGAEVEKEVDNAEVGLEIETAVEDLAVGGQGCGWLVVLGGVYEEAMAYAKCWT